MTEAEKKAFEAWLMKAYSNDDSVPFAVLAKALKVVRNAPGK